jgi:hypothetical protein
VPAQLTDTSRSTDKNGPRDTSAMSEAADLNEFFNAPAELQERILGRTASFCTERSGHFDAFDQGISFFLPNASWLQARARARPPRPSLATPLLWLASSFCGRSSVISQSDEQRGLWCAAAAWSCARDGA